MSKKPKVSMGESSQTIIVSLGHNINRRSAAYLFQYTYIAISPLWLFTNNSKNDGHAQQLQSLIALVPSNQSPLQVIDDKWEVLQRIGSQLVIFTSDR
jgi:hypothetical protein